MLKTGPDRPRVSSEIERAIEAEAEEELAEVFGGKGLEDHQVRANWYVAGLWPFGRISFECPGCSRWLSVKSSNSGRIGFCPSCDLTVASPDVEQNLPPALVSRAKEIPALPARRLPGPRPQCASGAKAEPQGEAAGGVEDADPSPEEIHRLNPERQPVWNRQHSLLDGEERWGINEDTELVPMRVVTRYQHLAPWLGCVALLIAAWGVGYAFMVSQRIDQPQGIPMVNSVQQKPRVPLGSELWVVLDALATAATPEEMVSLVRDPKEMLPKMQAYYAGAGVELPHRFERTRRGLKVYQLGAKRFARFEGRCDGRPVKFSFEGTEYGWRLDWESLVGYSDTDWGKFLVERLAGEYEFRLLANVIIDKELEYNREQYLCLHLIDHLETGHGFALLDRFSEQAVQLEKFLKLSDKARGAYPRTWITPVLRVKEGSDQLLELVGLKSASWLIP